MTEIELWANTQNRQFKQETLKRFESALQKITIPEIQQFTVFGVMKRSSEEKLSDALDAFDVLEDFLIKRRQYNPLCPSKMTDCVFSAMLLHNIWFNDMEDDVDDWVEVFSARKVMSDLATEFCILNHALADGAFDYIFQLIESQLGEDMPVQNCRPVTGQMSYCLWEVLWLYGTYLRGKKDADGESSHCNQKSKWELEATSWR